MDIDHEILSILKLDEQNENGEKYIPEYLYLFRRAIKDMKGISLFITDDIFLLRFLRTKKFNVKLSVKLLNMYAEMRTKVPDMGCIRFSTLKPLFAQGIFTVLRQRDSEGRKIIYFRFGQWDPDNFTYLQVLVAGGSLLEEMTRSEKTQKHGVVFIVDGSQLNFHRAKMIAMQFTFENIRHITVSTQDAFPVQYKGIHLIQCPLAVNAILQTIVFFLKQKLRKRVHFHGSDTKALHKFFKADDLPRELGGSYSIDEVEDKELMQSMFASGDFFKRLEDVYS